MPEQLEPTVYDAVRHPNTQNQKADPENDDTDADEHQYGSDK